MAKKAKPQEDPELLSYTTTAEPKAWADGVPVFCAHDAIVKVKDMKPNPKNPNQHPSEQINLLAAIIRATGWRGPITVSKRSGFIVRGHGRLMAAQLDDLAEVPVDYQSYASEAEEMADLVADNKIAELSDINNRLLAEVFADIDTGEIPFLLSGYTEEEYGNIVTALSEALHDQDEKTEAEEKPDEDPPLKIASPGDVWILGSSREQINAGLLDGIKAAKGEANAIIAGMNPKFVDVVLKEYIKATGKTDVRCIRQGKELPQEQIAGIFGGAEPDVEGGERE